MDYSVTFNDITDMDYIAATLESIAAIKDNLVEYILNNIDITITKFESYTTVDGRLAQRVNFTRTAELDDEDRIIQVAVFFQYLHANSDLLDYQLRLDNSMQYTQFIWDEGLRGLNNLDALALVEMSAELIDQIRAAGDDVAENPFEHYTYLFGLFNVSIVVFETVTDENGEVTQRIDYVISSSRETTVRPGGDAYGGLFMDFLLVHVTYYLYDSDTATQAYATLDFSNETRTYTLQEMEEYVNALAALSKDDLMSFELNEGMTLVVFETYINLSGEEKQRIAWTKSASLVSYNEEAVLETTLTLFVYANDYSKEIAHTISLSDLQQAIPYDNLDEIIATINAGGTLADLGLLGVVSYYETYRDASGDLQQRVYQTVATSEEIVGTDVVINVAVTTYEYDGNSNRLLQTVTTHSATGKVVTNTYESYTNMWGDESQRVSVVVVDDPVNGIFTTTYSYMNEGTIHDWYQIIHHTTTTSTDEDTNVSTITTSWYTVYYDYSGRMQQRLKCFT